MVELFDESHAATTIRLAGDYSSGAQPPAPAASSCPASTSSEGSEAPPAKRAARIVWTRELHGRFVDAVEELGLDNAMPKTILTIMDVEGITREHVASHLQKYRQHVRRITQHAQPTPVVDESITTKDLCYPPCIPASLLTNPLSFDGYGPLCNPTAVPPPLNECDGQ